MQTKTCPVSGRSFTVREADLEFYQKFDVPTPTLHPDERARRRMAWSNQLEFYRTTCCHSGKPILSHYPPEFAHPVMDIHLWNTDQWDQLATGRDYDFHRPFFDQFHDLLQVAPRPNLQRTPQYDENSDYTNYAGKNKNCYFVFDSDKNWDCYYSYSINSCQNCCDCFRLRSCELCYECIDCVSCYDSKFLQNCHNCSSSAFLKNCIGCHDCFGCVNLRNKQYYFMNEKCTKEEYQAKLAALRLDTYSGLSPLRAHFQQFVQRFPHRFMEGIQNENVTGNYLTHSKDSHECFDSSRLWGCAYVTQAFDDAKTCIDCTEVGDGAELLYECATSGYVCYDNIAITHCLNNNKFLRYCFYCQSSEHLFGCVGVNKAKFRILNQQYSEAEYQDLTKKIIEHMRSTGEWGEFFPIKDSPFYYNHSHAQDYLPLTRSQALARGYKWQDTNPKETIPQTIALPDSASDIPADITQQMLQCPDTGRNFKLQKSELKFYRDMALPLPRKSFWARHADRLALRLPRELHDRPCSVSGVPLRTPYHPDRPEQIVSEDVYNNEVVD